MRMQQLEYGESMIFAQEKQAFYQGTFKNYPFEVYPDIYPIFNLDIICEHLN